MLVYFFAFLVFLILLTDTISTFCDTFQVKFYNNNKKYDTYLGLILLQIQLFLKKVSVKSITKIFGKK
jgi:hypothetical protein